MSGRLQPRLVKTGGRLIKHARCDWLVLAESHLTRRLFTAMVRRIDLLPLPAGQASRRPDRISVTREAEAGKMPEAWVERGAVAVFGVLARGANGPFHGPWKNLALQTRLTIAFSGGQVYVIGRAGGR
jgi:hypothetical protein